MLVFVDFEHADGRKQEWGQRNLAARTWITYRLEDLSGKHCMLVRYDRITAELLAQLDAEAIFISGNGTAPELYQPEALAPLHDIVRTSALPMFGFCGGFQCISAALDSDVVPLDIDDSMDGAPGLITREDGRPFEFGYHPIDVTGSHEVLDGLGESPVFRHAHGLHVPQPPPDFKVVASTQVTPVQVAISDERKIIGTQFHPEYWTDEHPEGETLIANFMRWVNLI